MTEPIEVRPGLRIHATEKPGIYRAEGEADPKELLEILDTLRSGGEDALKRYRARFLAKRNE